MEHWLQLVNEASAKTRDSVFPGNEACNPGTSEVGHNLSEFVKTTEQCMERTFTKTRRKIVKKNKKQQISTESTHAEVVVSPQDSIDPSLSHNSYKGLLLLKFAFRPVETSDGGA